MSKIQNLCLSTCLLIFTIALFSIGVIQAHAEEPLVRYDLDGNSQWVNWSRVEPYYNNHHIAVDNMGNVFAAGNEDELYLKKYDQDGNELWAFGNELGYAYVGDIAVDSQGDLLLTLNDNNGAMELISVVKISDSGEMLYRSWHDCPGFTKCRAWDIGVDASDNIFVTGESVNDLSSGHDHVTFKLDPEGELVWQNVYDNGDNTNDAAYDQYVDEDGNVYVTGESWIGESYGAYLVQYTPSGNEAWVSIFDRQLDSWEIGLEVKKSSDGDLYVLMESGYDVCIVKYDSQGQEIWSVFLQNDDNYYPRRLAVDAVGGVVVAGTINPYISEQRRSIFCVKYNSEGQQEWLQTVVDPHDMEVGVFDVEIDQYNNVYVMGYICLDGSGDFVCHDFQYITIKYDSDGQELWMAEQDDGGDNPWDDLWDDDWDDDWKDDDWEDIERPSGIKQGANQQALFVAYPKEMEIWPKSPEGGWSDDDDDDDDACGC